ncbi:MAG: CRISPR-associated endonuclease Cas2 [Myxococcales bacterium]|nr:CRISPR-associated endonuclease Cas2 [Myxococcales bacterium]MCB9714277.1 CRISPR-associated endonuclease Cas2 [Myxococcales bacterium]
MRHHFIVAYDISDPQRLRQVHKTVRDFGTPLQLSVFACTLSSLDRATLQARLLTIIDTTADQVMFVRLAPVHPGDTRPPGCETLGRPLRARIDSAIVT